MERWILGCLKAAVILACVAASLIALQKFRSPIDCQSNVAFYLKGTQADCAAVNPPQPQERQLVSR